MITVPSRQEMFKMACDGLAGQRWQRSTSMPINDGDRVKCVYDDGNGRRCAWGHVDLSLTQQDHGNLLALHCRGVGLAASLRMDDRQFASELQIAHDLSHSGCDMRIRMRDLAARYGLTLPTSLPESE